MHTRPEDSGFKELLQLLSEKDGVDYLSPNLRSSNIPLSIIPLLKCENKVGAVEHLLQDMIKEYHPEYNHEQFDRIFATAIDYLDDLENRRKVSSNINNIRSKSTQNSNNLSTTPSKK